MSTRSKKKSLERCKRDGEEKEEEEEQEEQEGKGGEEDEKTYWCCCVSAKLRLSSQLSHQTTVQDSRTKMIRKRQRHSSTFIT